MNSIARKFFQSEFDEWIILSEEPKFSWEKISEMGVDLPRGWFELSRCSPKDRVEFTLEFWLNAFPFHPIAHPFFTDFFSRLSDVSVLLRRKKSEEPWVAELVYCLADESCFFRGLRPANHLDIEEFKQEIGDAIPRDYLSFMKIHNGFGRLSEMGMVCLEEVFDLRRKLVGHLLKAEWPLQSGQKTVDPSSLIPFYEVEGMFSFQCFTTDWYPGSEMGNVYLSGIDYIVSDTTDRKKWVENLAFPTFLDWLVYFLEGMDSPS